jgi:hypothetical protein
LIEWVRGVVQRLLAAVVFPLAMQLPALAVLVVFLLLVMLWVWVLAIQVVLLLVLVEILLYRRQTLPSRCQVVCVSWCLC